MKRIPIHFFLSLCLASFVFGALTLSSAVPSAHAQPGPVRVTYTDTAARDYSYGKCIPMNLNEHPADTIKVNKPVRGNLFPDPYCRTRIYVPIELHSGLNNARNLQFYPSGSLLIYHLQN